MTAVVLGATTVKPVQSIRIEGEAKDMVVHAPHVYIGTSRGKLQVYDYETKTFTKEIRLPKIKDFMGDMIDAPIGSIDYLGGRYLILSDSGEKGYSDLWLHENNVTKRILSPKDKKTLVKARFVDADHVLLGTLGNEAVLFDLRTRKEIYREQLSESKFSDFALNVNRTQAAFGCESGEITVIDVSTGKILKRLNSINKDNVYKVAFRNGIVAAAGQDRRAAWYDVRTGKGDFFQAHFLIYATGLSPSARYAAFAMDEDNSISIYDLRTRSKIAVLKGQKSTLNTIVFVDEKTLFSGSDDDTVMMWQLP
jgi:WD40 repeat protein